jgi:hypothetical protein
MTNDKPPVAPVEGFYAMLRNGNVLGPVEASKHRPGEFTSQTVAFYWTSTGEWSSLDRENEFRKYDIITTISPEAMALAAGLVEPSKPQTTMHYFDKPLTLSANDYTIMPTKLAEALNSLVPLADAVLDHADAHCRAFPIATAPKSSVALFHGFGWVKEDYTDENGVPWHYKDATHWSPVPKLELPAVFTQLGQALEKIKGAG